MIGIQRHVRNNLAEIRTEALAKTLQQFVGLSGYDQCYKLKKKYSDYQEVAKTVNSHVKQHEKAALPYFSILKTLFNFFIHVAFPQRLLV